MRRVAIVLIGLVTGSISGWLLLAGFCNIPMIKSGNSCGHNAYLWLLIFLPIGLVGGVYLTRHLAKADSRKKHTQNKA